MDRQGTRTVLIAGGGVAALEAALALRALAEDRVNVELLAPDPHFWYAPLAVAAPFKLAPLRRFELSELATTIGATFVPGALASVDENRRVAYTTPGGPVSYSWLLVGCGAIPQPVVEGALTFRGPADTEEIERLLAEIEAGEVHRLAVVVPAGAVWGLPAYELALMIASWAASRAPSDVELALVTPEDEPLRLFGAEVSAAVRALLDDRGIAFHPRAYAAEAREGELLLADSDVLAADRVVALPRLEGPHIGGIPQTFEGFIPVDAYGRVIGMSSIYAAGDITTFGVKQGGIAAQQADAAAEAIAAEAGCDLTPQPFRPVLRGLLLTGAEPRYLYGAADESKASSEALWWPPAKIVGRYLAPFLAEIAGTETGVEPSPESGVSVDIELDLDVGKSTRRDRLLGRMLERTPRESSAVSVEDVMFGEPLLVGPENTLGEVAQEMNRRDVGSALVVEHGRLVGILTSRDMLRAMGDRVHSGEARAVQWMTAEPITVSAQTTAQAAAALFEEHGIHHLPVVEGDRPVGMVGLRQIVHAQAVRAGMEPYDV